MKGWQGPYANLSRLSQPQLELVFNKVTEELQMLGVRASKTVEEFCLPSRAARGVVVRIAAPVISACSHQRKLSMRL